MLQYLVLIFVAMVTVTMGQHFQSGNDGMRCVWRGGIGKCRPNSEKLGVQYGPTDFINIDSFKFNEGKQNQYSNSIVVLAGYGKWSHVINLNGQKCDPLPNFPFEILYPTGMFFNNSITLCGGEQVTYLANNEVKWRTSEKCFTLRNGLWDTPIAMLKKRSRAKSIVVGKDLWISGGANVKEDGHYVDQNNTWVHDDSHWTMFRDSEIISENGSQKLGPLLPPNHGCHSNGTLMNHKLLSINETHTLLIGGVCVYNGFNDPSNCETNSTFYYDHLNQLWSQGPDMKFTFDTSDGEGAGIIVDKITGEKNVIVLHVGGETEILKIGTNKWTRGPILIPDGYKPMTAFLSFPLTVAMTDEFFVFGGNIVEIQSSFLLHNYIVYKMACENDNCLWSKMPVQLSQGFDPYPAAFLVPNEVLNCK